MIRWLDALVNRHKGIRRLLLLWAMALITWAVRYAFVYRPDIPAGAVAALGSVIGLLTVVVGFYQWSRAHDDSRARRDAAASQEKT